jgi:hypothetical protein
MKPRGTVHVVFARGKVKEHAPGGYVEQSTAVSDNARVLQVSHSTETDPIA